MQKAAEEEMKRKKSFLDFILCIQVTIVTRENIEGVGTSFQWLNIQI